jgi:hypothetical protein
LFIFKNTSENTEILNWRLLPQLEHQLLKWTHKELRNPSTLTNNSNHSYATATAAVKDSLLFGTQPSLSTKPHTVTMFFMREATNSNSNASFNEVAFQAERRSMPSNGG